MSLTLTQARRFLKSCALTAFTQTANARTGNLCFKADLTTVFIEALSQFKLVAHDPHRDLVVYVDPASDIAIRIQATGRIVMCAASTYGRRMVAATDSSKLRTLDRVLNAKTVKKPPITTEKEFFQRGVAAYRAAAKDRGYKVIKAPTGILEAFDENSKLRGRYDHAKEKNSGWLK